ncbi:MAG: hypothetical protein H6712_31650 [Myxococcales bacterium]|nr:hypothetical protein [Myxococcales bacterium]MCB9718447.1 hypothetical protein [Myxococcales bacterium]
MRTTRPRSAGLALAALLLGPFACDGGDDEEPIGAAADEGELAPCDEQPVITYDTFGRGFLATYCDGCHGSDVVARQGAPPDVVFDSREGAADWADRILARSAPPDGSPATMPPVGGVTAEDRDRLVVWLTCWE